MLKKIGRYLTNIMNFASNIWVQIMSILVTVVALALIGYHFSTYYSAIEKDPEINYVVPKEKDIKKDYAAIVNVGLHINNFWKFDVNNNNFVVDAVLWFNFNPSSVSIGSVDKFEIENAEIKRRTGPIIRMIEGKLFAYYYLRIEFKSLLDYRNFPFDDHRLFIIITNKSSGKEFLYTTDKESFSRLSLAHYLKDYKFIGYDARFGYQSVPLHFWDQRKEVSYPVAVFSLDFAKSGSSDSLIIFIPLVFMFFFAVISLIFDIANERTIISLALGSLSGLTLYRFIMQGVSPVGAGLMISDKFYFFVLSFSFLIFIFEIGLLSYIKDDPVRTNRANRVKEILFLLVLIALVVYMYNLLPTEI